MGLCGPSCLLHLPAGMCRKEKRFLIRSVVVRTAKPCARERPRREGGAGVGVRAGRSGERRAWGATTDLAPGGGGLSWIAAAAPRGPPRPVSCRLSCQPAFASCPARCPASAGPRSRLPAGDCDVFPLLLFAHPTFTHSRAQPPPMAAVRTLLAFFPACPWR